MPFLSTLDTRSVSGGKFKLLEPLIYQSLTGDTHTVPIDFETDFASLPGIVRVFLPVNGKHRMAATLHDYLYNSGITTRKLADNLFREAMASDGVRVTRRLVMFAGVRSFGWLFYNKANG